MLHRVSLEAGDSCETVFLKLKMCTVQVDRLAAIVTPFERYSSYGGVKNQRHLKKDSLENGIQRETLLFASSKHVSPLRFGSSLPPGVPRRAGRRDSAGSPVQVAATRHRRRPRRPPAHAVRAGPGRQQGLRRLLLFGRGGTCTRLRVIIVTGAGPRIKLGNSEESRAARAGKTAKDFGALAPARAGVYTHNPLRLSHKLICAAYSRPRCARHRYKRACIRRIYMYIRDIFDHYHWLLL